MEDPAELRCLTKLLKAFEPGKWNWKYFDQSIESRFGHMEHADTYNYIRETKKTIEELKERKAV